MGELPAAAVAEDAASVVAETVPSDCRVAVAVPWSPAAVVAVGSALPVGAGVGSLEPPLHEKRANAGTAATSPKMTIRSLFVRIHTAPYPSTEGFTAAAPESNASPLASRDHRLV